MTTLDELKELYTTNPQAARAKLVAFLQAHPADAAAWQFLGAKTTDLGQRKYCYERALALNPESETLAERLAKLSHVESVPLATVASTKPNRFATYAAAMFGLVMLCACCCCTPWGRMVNLTPTPLAVVSLPTAAPTATPYPLPTAKPPTPTPSPTPSPAPPPTLPTAQESVAEQMADLCLIELDKKTGNDPATRLIKDDEGGVFDVRSYTKKKAQWALGQTFAPDVHLDTPTVKLSGGALTSQHSYLFDCVLYDDHGTAKLIYFELELID